VKVKVDSFLTSFMLPSILCYCENLHICDQDRFQIRLNHDALQDKPLSAVNLSRHTAPRLEPDIQFPNAYREAIPTLHSNRTPILSFGEADVKCPKKIRRHTAQLHHRQLLAHTIVHTSAEGHKGALINHSIWLLVGPALGHELKWPRKVAWVALQTVGWHPDDDVTGYVYPVGKCYAFGWCLALDA
jgi:hypothetical protein